MELTPKERVAVSIAAALMVGVVLAVAWSSWRWSFLILAGMVLFSGSLTMLGLRRQDRLRSNALDRIERKIDNLALRLVTESEATHRELGGLIEDLGSALRDNGLRKR